jgi:hypothetical protein
MNMMNGFAGTNKNIFFSPRVLRGEALIAAVIATN